MRRAATVVLIAASAALPAVGPAQDGRHPESRGTGNGKIAFVQGDSIRLFEPDSGKRPERLTRGWAPAWSPDGRTVAFSDDLTPSVRTIFLINANGSGRRRLPLPVGGERRISNDFPAWSPDGARIAFTRYVLTRRSGRVRRLESDIFVVGAAGGTPRRLTTSGGADSPTWSPDSRRLAYSGAVAGGSEFSRRLHVVNSDGTGDHTLDAATRASWAPDGHTVVWPPAWSPDGRRIAFARPPEPAALAEEIYVIGADGTGLRRLTHRRQRGCGQGERCAPGYVGPSWSPDGRHIVFLAVPSLLQVMNADGSGLHTVVRGRELWLLGGPEWQPLR
jgi:Tol biopolymer transport system component